MKQPIFSVKTKINVNDEKVVLLSKNKLEDNALAELKKVFEQGAVAAVMRTVPLETGFFCDPITLATESALNETFVIREDACEQIGGIDNRFGTACATELCISLKAAKKYAVYAPKACCNCHDGLTPDYAQSLTDTLLLKIKYGTAQDIKQGIALILKALLHPTAYKVSRTGLIKQLFGSFGATVSMLFARIGKAKALKNTKTNWYGASLGFSRGSLNSDTKLTEKPLVSLIVRTRNRPETLRKTLESLRKQTYENFEIVVVEDGEAQCKEMLERDFSDLPIRYHPTGVNIGRSAAFNQGVSFAKGTYLNMLDDDDFLYPEHIEIAIKQAQKSGCDIVFFSGIALETEKLSDEPYRFKIWALRLLDFVRVEPFTMVRRCVTTENGILFKRSLCQSVGGMREELQAHEDWNLWLRLMSKGTWTHCHYATNCYLVPHDPQEEQARLQKYAVYNDALLEDETLVFATDLKQRTDYRNSMKDDYRYLVSLQLANQTLVSEKEAAEEFLNKEKLYDITFDSLENRAETITLSGKELKALYCNEILKFCQAQSQGKLERLLNEPNFA